MLQTSREETSLKSGLLSHQYIFIVGAPRSGTSLVKKLFDLHSDVSGLSTGGERNDEGFRVYNCMNLQS